MNYPKCFDSKKAWKAWVELAEKSGLENPCLSYCTDCSVSYRDEMISKNRCEHPDTYFITILNEDEELERIGVRSDGD